MAATTTHAAHDRRTPRPTGALLRVTGLKRGHRQTREELRGRAPAPTDRDPAAPPVGNPRFAGKLLLSMRSYRFSSKAAIRDLSAVWRHQSGRRLSQDAAVLDAQGPDVDRVWRTKYAQDE